MQDIDSFIESLLQDNGIADADPDVKEEMKSEIKPQLIKQIEKEAVLNLSEEKIGELANLMDAPDFTDDKMLDFLRNAGVNLDEVAEKTKPRFRAAYLNLPEEQA